MPKYKKSKLRKHISSLEKSRSDLKSTSHNGSKENIGSEEQTGETIPVEDEISKFKYKSQSQAFPLNNINKNLDDVIQEAHNTIQISEKKKIENELKEEIQKVDKVKEEEKKQKEKNETQQEINENKVEVKVTITQTTTILNASEQEVIKEIKGDDLIKETITGKDAIQLKKKPQIIYSQNIKDKKRHSIELLLIDSDENSKNNKKASILKNKTSFQNKSSFFDIKNNTEANSNMNSTEEPKSRGICADCLIY